MFYQFCQNNSFGYFEVDEKVCHRIFIESDSVEEAVNKAKELGVYFDGVSLGKDCPCCGDRWNEPSIVNLEKYKERGYGVCIFDHHDNPEELWVKKYGKYNILKTPQWKDGYYCRQYEGRIYFNNIEERAQFLANEFGWTNPDSRIYYKDGSVKEIYGGE